MLFRSGLLLPRLREVSPARTRNATIAVGALLGVLVTISSVGAGALGVTALLLLYPRSALPTIVGSDIAHAVPLTLVAGVGHLFLGDVNVALLISLLSGSIPGVIVGSWYAPRVPELALRALMASVLGVAGLRLVM